MPDTQLSIQITTGKSTDSRDPSTVHLRVEDQDSGEPLVVMDIEAWRWWDILTGGGRVLPGFVGNHLDRVGKAMETSRLTPDREIFWRDGSPYPTKDEQRDLVDAWAQQQPDAADWETATVRQTGSGWSVIRHRWVEKAP